MRVKILRVSNMPHGVEIWLDRQPHRCTYYVDRRLLSAEGAELIEMVAAAHIAALRPGRRGAAG